MSAARTDVPTPPRAPAVPRRAERDAMLLVAFAVAPAWPPRRVARAADALATLARHEATLARWHARSGDMDESAIRLRESVFLSTEAERVRRALRLTQ